MIEVSLRVKIVKLLLGNSMECDQVVKLLQQIKFAFESTVVC